jgi:AcrR family transcriptional regulator
MAARNRPATSLSVRDRILAVTRDLIGELGYNQVTMRRIAAAVGIKAPSIYRHFASKEDLVFELIRDGRLRLAAVMRKAYEGAASPRDAILAGFRAWVRFGVENPGYYRLMFMHSFPPEAVARVRAEITDRIQPGVAEAAAQIRECNPALADQAEHVAHAHFIMRHGLVSILALQRADLVFDSAAVEQQLLRLLAADLGAGPRTAGHGGR